MLKFKSLFLCFSFKVEAPLKEVFVLFEKLFLFKIRGSEFFTKYKNATKNPYLE